jgi:hypothetical protein
MTEKLRKQGLNDREVEETGLLYLPQIAFRMTRSPSRVCWVGSLLFGCKTDDMYHSTLRFEKVRVA